MEVWLRYRSVGVWWSVWVCMHVPWERRQNGSILVGEFPKFYAAPNNYAHSLLVSSINSRYSRLSSLR